MLFLYLHQKLNNLQFEYKLFKLLKKNSITRNESTFIFPMWLSAFNYNQQTAPQGLKSKRLDR